MSTDRLPPHSPEAERGALGCVTLDPNAGLSEICRRFKNPVEVFYDLRHQTLMEAMLGMLSQGVPITLVSLYERLKDLKVSDSVGIEYISKLQDEVPSAANLPTYLDILQEKFLLRKMVQVCTDTVAKIYEHEGDSNALMDEVEREVLSVRSFREPKEQRDIRSLIKSAVDQIEEFHQKQGRIDGLVTGFPDYDRLTLGLHPGDMTVLAAYPSVGKTSLLMNVVEHICVDQGAPALVFSFEMTAEQLAFRLLLSRARVNLKSAQEGFLHERDFPKITGAAVKLANSKLFVEDISDLTIMQVRARARRYWQEHGIKFIGLDYLQLVEPGSGKKSETRENEVARISKNVKAMAKELKIPVWALSQLTDDGKLRESRAIGQDADNVGFLQSKATEEDAGKPAIPVDWLIKKQRSGPAPETVHLTFLKGFTRFESAAKIDPSDVQGNFPYRDS